MFTKLTITLCLLWNTFSQSCLSTFEYSDANTGLCLPCPTSCLSCFDNQFCTACVAQYYLNGSICSPCPFGCSVCTDSSLCTTCIQGLYINAQGKCVACANGVKSCTIAILESCNSGYFLLGNICAGCFANCAICQDFVTCLTCNIGYYVDSNSVSCLPCSSNCSVCQDASTCTSCSQGYVLSGGSCISPSCSSISPFCKKCSNGQCE